MPALRRLYLLVIIVFMVLSSVALLLLLRQAREDVARELQVAEGVADIVYETLLRDPQSVSPALSNNLVHVRVQWQDALIYQPESALEAWLRPLLVTGQSAPRIVEMADGRRLQISVNSHDEVTEVCDSLMQMFWFSLFALFFSLLCCRWVGQFVLLAFDELLEVLQRVQVGNTTLTQALMTLQDDERARLGQTLHDDLGQYVSGMRAQVCLLLAVADNPEQVRSTTLLLLQHTQHLQEGFRALVRDLYPVMLEHLELEQALQLFTEAWQESTGVRCRVIVGQHLPRLPLPIKAHLYRLIQEALTNVTRHAHASEVRIRLQGGGKCLRLFIRDNGCGAQLPQQPGVGLYSMQERARSLGAQLRLYTRPGAGWALDLMLRIEGSRA